MIKNVPPCTPPGPFIKGDNYFIITEGFKEAAEKFRLEAGISPLGDKNSDLSSMDNRIKIRDCIQAGKISEATALVHQLHPELLDDDRYLFFHLQVFLKKLSLLKTTSGLRPLSFILRVSNKKSKLFFSNNN